jgi:threonine aldolase
MKAIYNLGKKYNIPIHLDGARIFNAAAALGVEAKEIAQYTDTLMFCISKGLGAPGGSLVVGTKEFV